MICIIYFNKNKKLKFSYIYRIRKIRKSITFKTSKSVVTSLVYSTLEY